MTIAEYIRDPAPAPSLSASIAHKLLTQSPRHAWLAHPRLNPQWAPESTTEQELGTIVHAMLLEGDSSRIAVVDAPDWRTALARRERDLARAVGKLPILAHKLPDVMDMVASARKAINDAPEIRKAFADGKPEQTLVWKDGDVYCRCRPDWMTNDYRLIIDVKTTGGSGEPDGWGRGPMLSMGYDVQGAFCLRAVKQLYKPRDVSFVDMIIETDPPYAVSFVGLAPSYEDFAEAKRASALETFRFCMQTDSWPGYPPRICWAEPPGYALTRWEEAHMVGGGVDDL